MPICQLTKFSFPDDQLLVFDGDPNLIQALEKFSILLGSTPSENESHSFIFDIPESHSVPTSLALEMVWNSINAELPSSIHLVCGTQTLLLEGNSPCFKLILSLVDVFGKDINSDEIEFYPNEKYKFNIINEILNNMEFMPFFA